MIHRRTWLVLGGTTLLLAACACPQSRCPRTACPRLPTPTSYLMNLDEPRRTRQRIVVARVVLRAGTALRTSLLTVKDQPPRFTWAGHLRPVDLVHFAGRRLRRTIPPGAPIRRADLAGAPGDRSAARLLPRGARSVTLRVDWVGGSGTWVGAGDHVDVGLVRRSAPGVKPTLLVLMQNARVLMASTYPGPGAGVKRLWVSVLALPREAHGLALAQRLGHIVLFPRSGRQTRPVVYRPVTLRDLQSPGFWQRLQRRRSRTIQRRQVADDPGIRIK